MATTIPPVRIVLEASGINEVKQALKSVRDTLVELEVSSVKTVAKSSKERIKILHQEMVEREKIAKHLAKVEGDLSRAMGKGGVGTRRLSVGSNTNNSNFSGGGGSLSSMFGEGAGAGGAEMAGLAKLGTAAGIAGAAVLVLKKGLDIASEALKAFGGFVLHEVIQPQLKREVTAQQIANASMGQLTREQVLETSRAVAIKHNIDPEDVMSGQKMFQDITGSPKLGMDIGDVIGMISKSRGVPSADLYGLAAGVYAAGDTKENIQNKLLKVVAQGDIGAIPIDAMARMGTRIKPLLSGMKGNSEEKLSQANALLQSSRIGSPEMTMTAAEEFMMDVTKNRRIRSQKFIKKGREGKEITDVGDLIGEIYAKTKGDIGRYTQSHKLEKGSFEILNAHKDTYDDAYTKALEAGKKEKEARELAAKAVTDHIHEIQNANMSYQQARSEEEKVLQLGAEKWDAAVRRIKDKLLEIMPEVTKFIDEITPMAPAIATAALLAAKAIISLAKLIYEMFPSLKGAKEALTVISNYEKQEEERKNKAKEDEENKKKGLPGTGEMIPPGPWAPGKEPPPVPLLPYVPPGAIPNKPKEETPTVPPTSTEKTAGASLPTEHQTPSPEVQAAYEQIKTLGLTAETLSRVFKDLASSGGALNRDKAFSGK